MKLLQLILCYNYNRLGTNKSCKFVRKITIKIWQQKKRKSLTITIINICFHTFFYDADTYKAVLKNPHC